MGEVPSNMPEFPLGKYDEKTSKFERNSELAQKAFEYVFQEFIKQNKGPEDENKQKILRLVMKNFLEKIYLNYEHKRSIEEREKEDTIKQLQAKIERGNLELNLELLLGDIKLAYGKEINRRKRHGKGKNE